MAAEAKKLISVVDIADLKSTIKKVTDAQLQAENLKSFENDFFTGKCTGSKNEE